MPCYIQALQTQQPRDTAIQVQSHFPIIVAYVAIVNVNDLINVLSLLFAIVFTAEMRAVMLQWLVTAVSREQEHNGVF